VYEKWGGVFEFVDGDVYFGVVFEIFDQRAMKIQVMYPGNEVQAKTVLKHMTDLFFESYNS
jgi:hypothetical protein